MRRSHRKRKSFGYSLGKCLGDDTTINERTHGNGISFHTRRAKGRETKDARLTHLSHLAAHSSTVIYTIARNHTQFSSSTTILLFSILLVQMCYKSVRRATRRRIFRRRSNGARHDFLLRALVDARPHVKILTLHEAPNEEIPPVSLSFASSIRRTRSIRQTPFRPLATLPPRASYSPCSAPPPFRHPESAPRTPRTPRQTFHTWAYTFPQSRACDPPVRRPRRRSCARDRSIDRSILTASVTSLSRVASRSTRSSPGRVPSGTVVSSLASRLRIAARTSSSPVRPSNCEVARAHWTLWTFPKSLRGGNPKRALRHTPTRDGTEDPTEDAIERSNANVHARAGRAKRENEPVKTIPAIENEGRRSHHRELRARERLARGEGSDR